MGYQPDSERYQSDSTGYQAQGSGGMSAAWPRDADPRLRKIVEQAAGQRGDKWRAECLRCWRHFEGLAGAGYGDKHLALHLFFEGMLETDDWPPRKPKVPIASLPQADLPSGMASSRYALARQLNVRLRESDYARLVEVADRYDVSGTSLARLFIIRGIEAAIREVDGG